MFRHPDDFRRDLNKQVQDAYDNGKKYGEKKLEETLKRKEALLDEAVVWIDRLTTRYAQKTSGAYFYMNGETARDFLQRVKESERVKS